MKLKERESNFELMRVISMFMIVFWHVLVHGKVLQHTTGVTNLLCYLLMCIFLVHVNSFILACGYFQSEHQFSLKKFLNLFCLQWFYRVVIIIILSLFNLISISRVDFINELLPLDVADYWFINCYLTLYLLSPYLNKLISSLTNKEHKKLLLLSFVLFSIVPYITSARTIDNSGYTIIQFCFLYLIGAYLKKYPIKENYYFKRFTREKRQLIFLTLFIVCFTLNFIIMLFANQLDTYSNELVKEIASCIRNSQFNYSTPLVIIQSISYFLYFETLKIKSKKINILASVTLGVYLIHDNTYIRNIIYKAIKINSNKMLTSSSLIYILICTLLIFIVCSLIELIRHNITKFICNKKNIIAKKNKFYDYLGRL